MRRALALVTVIVLSTLPASARAGGFDLRLGAFFPRAESNLLREDFVLYTVEKSDFVGFTGGVEFNARLATNLELGVSVDGYGRSIDTVYRNFVRDDGGEIFQTLKMDIVPVGVTLRFIPFGSRAAISPYLAGGGDVFYWNYEEVGDFIDFGDPTHPVYPDHFKADGVTFGGHAAVGLRIRMTHDIALVAEGKYQWAKESDMGDDFYASVGKNELDLSGPSATLGVHIRF